ncbi:MAG: UDP-N-acetylglucosamine 2-epimerase [Planctomycetota bacterium]
MSRRLGEPRIAAVVTGTRADYGLLETVCRAIDQHAGLSLRLVVTGTHLTQRTLSDIAFPVAAKVTMQKRDRFGRRADAAALGRGVSGLTEAFASIGPEFVVVLGDRIEAFAAASAASVMGIRVVHLHGGDRAEGVADEAMRHAITKLAHLHLPATAASGRRILKMGEQRETIRAVGSPAIDDLSTISADPEANDLIILVHPVGHDDATERRGMANVLAATSKCDRLVLSPNADPGRDGILNAIRDAGIDPVEHLPRRRFVSMLKGANAMVGNSSAGLIEAAACKTPCVNIGPRQNGRDKPNSVVDATYSPRSIRSALSQALRLDPRRFRHPYGKGDTGRKVADLLASIDLRKVPIRKLNAY